MTGSAFIVLGKIVGAYGVQGWVRVHPFADDPASWVRIKAWQLGREGEAPETWREVVPRRSKLRSEGLLVQLEGVTDRTAAKALKGLLVGAAREAMPATGEGEYYWADLIGLEVVNGRDERLGSVKELIESAASDVLVVVADDGTERLLPFVGAVVTDVDVVAKRIRVEWEADW